jgi:hypothetical protein
LPIDFEERTVEKLDKLESLIRDLCDRTTKTEIMLENHFKEQEQKRESSNRKFYIIMALMGAGFTLFEILREVIQ